MPLPWWVRRRVSRQALSGNRSNSSCSVFPAGLPALLARRRQGADVLLGDHQVVPPNLARALLGLGHVAVEPDGVDVEIQRASPSEAWEWPTALDSNTFTLR